MILLCGLPGSGKTTIGKELASRIDYAFLEASDTAKAFYERDSDSEETYMEYVDRIFREESGRRFANKIAQYVIEELGKFPGVIVSGLRYSGEIEIIRQMISNVRIAYLQCPDKVRRDRKVFVDPYIRLSVRERDKIELAWHVPEIEFLADYVLDSQNPFDECVASLTEWIG